MKRPSYRRAVQWVADNDSSGEPGAYDADEVEGMLSVALVADMFELSTVRVAKDVVRRRMIELEKGSS